MGNLVRIEDWRELREKQEESKPEKQGVKKVSVDDGFTAIPNELLKAILRSKVLGWKGSYLLATILKTLSWRKESDWFTHSQVCEMMEIAPTKYHINQLSAARKELLKERILFEDGKKTGVNLSVFSWEMLNPEKVGSSRNNRELVPEKVGSAYPEKVGNTKETITKEKIKDNPLPPKGESANADVTEGQGDTPPDEDFPSDEKQKIDRTDYIGIAQAYNDALDLTCVALPRIADPSNLSDKRKRAVKKLSEVFKKRFGDGSASALGEYFTDFMRSAREFYFGENNRGWKADFDFLLRENTLDKVLEGNL